MPGNWAGVDHVDAEFGEPFELLEVSVEIGERVFEEANGFPDLGDVATHRITVAGQHVDLVGKDVDLGISGVPDIGILRDESQCLLLTAAADQNRRQPNWLGLQIVSASW